MHGSFFSLFSLAAFFLLSHLFPSSPCILENTHLFPVVYLPTISFFFISISACNGGVEIIKTASGTPPLFFFPLSGSIFSFFTYFFSTEIWCMHPNTTRQIALFWYSVSGSRCHSLGGNNMHYMLNRIRLKMKFNLFSVTMAYRARQQQKRDERRQQINLLILVIALADK